MVISVKCTLVICSTNSGASFNDAFERVMHEYLVLWEQLSCYVFAILWNRVASVQRSARRFEFWKAL